MDNLYSYSRTRHLRTDLIDGYRLAGTAAALNLVASGSLGGAPAAVFVNLPANFSGVMLAPDADLD